MKTQRWINILVTMALVLLVFSKVRDASEIRCPMAIDLTTGAKIDMGNLPASVAGATRTFMAWVYLTATSPGSHALLYIYSGGNTYTSIDYYDGTTVIPNQWNFHRYFDTVGANFRGAQTLGLATWSHIAITYDESSAANVPIYYINGDAIATTVATTPIGTVVSDSGIPMYLGYFNANNQKMIISDVRIYNRILTPAEILEIYKRRCVLDNIINGLVFAPVLYGAAGLQAFDGTTLAAGNTIKDHISGASGTPSGTPIGKGETI